MPSRHRRNPNIGQEQPRSGQTDTKGRSPESTTSRYGSAAESDTSHGHAELVHSLQQEIAERRLAEKKLRESEARYRQLFNEMISGFAVHEMIYDEDGKPSDYRFLDVNPVFEKLTGLKKEDIVGRTVLEVLPETEPRWIETYGKVALTGRPVHFEDHHEGLDRHYEVIAYRPEKGKFAVMFNEITDRKRAEEELRKSAEKIKFFAYSVSHDIKSPAIALRGFTRLLDKEFRDILPDEAREYLDLIMGSSEEITSLVEKINLFIETKESPLDMSKVRPRDVFRRIRKEFAPILERRQVRWMEPDHVPEIQADKSSILRVFRNFTDNALKHGGDSLSLIEAGYRESDEFHILFLRDDGVLIKKEDFKKIFGFFKRTKSARSIEGVGLGLAIVKEIAEKHGGKVWVESTPETGTTFYFSICKTLQPMRGGKLPVLQSHD